VRTRFEAESLVRWSDSCIHTAVNEGLDELSESARFVERVVSVPIAARNFYDLRGYVPDDFVSVRAIWSTVREDWLTPTSEHLLHERWEESTGDPHSFFKRGWNWIVVYPRATSATGFLRVYLSCLAPQLLHGQAVTEDLPDDFAPALEDYALYDLQAQDGETRKALGHWKEFSERQRNFGEFVESRGRTSGFIGGAR
jgi:hypothetical protein